MEMTRKWGRRLQLAATQFLLGTASLALITLACFQLGFGVARTGFAYVILIALVSALGSFTASVMLSIAAAAFLNYFFAPPLFTFYIDAQEDIVRIATFLTTSLVVTALMTKLRASEARFRTFVDRATDAFFLLDDDLTVLDVNRQACDGLGYSREELIGKHPRDFDVGLDDASMQRLRQRVVAGEAVDFESRHGRKDGSSFPVEIRVTQFEQGGRRFLCLVRDITERKRAEDELRASEERFRSYLDHAMDGFFLFDEEQAIVDVNRQACESLGYSRDEMIGMRPRDFDAGLDDTSIAEIRERVKTGEIVTFESLHRRKDGTVFPVEVRSRRFQHGAHWFRLSLARDNTERKRAAEALRRSENYLTEAQRLSHTGSWAWDPHKDRMVYCSKELLRVYGMAPRQDIPTIAEFMEHIHPEDRDRVRQESVDRGGGKIDHAMEYRLLLPDGTLKYVRSIRHAIPDSSGEISEVIGTVIDVTERKRAQEERERLRQLESDLAHVNRLSIMGEMTATLAHEILHPIGAARNNARAAARFLDLSPPDLKEVRDALDCVVRDTDLAKDIVGRIRAHMKKAPTRNDRFDLNEAISEVIVMVQSAIENSGVLVHTRLREGLLPVRGDRVQLQQVVLNLILNAIDAMSAVKKGARKLSITTEQSQSRGVLVAIRDSGPGIDAEKIEQVFQPFYTTKASGMGMGLSICRSIIAAHGGRLWAEANQPAGAVFLFTLPADLEDS